MRTRDAAGGRAQEDVARADALTRRELLRRSGLVLGGIAIAGCAPSGAPGPVVDPGKTAVPLRTASTELSKPVTPRVATLEEELALPQSVLQAAEREGKFSFISSIDEKDARKMLDVFTKRYPRIEPKYQEASEEVRSVRTLTEFKAGRNNIDVVGGIGGFMVEYKDAKALRPLGDLPAYRNYDPPFRDPDHEWVGATLRFWGVGVNTTKVKAGELPKTWEDLVDAKWKGRIGLGDRPNLWVQQLWKIWGPDRTTDFLKKLFANQPQRRKEGLGASARLLGAGEYDLYIPAAPYTIQELKEKGTPVSWMSPEPLAVAVSEIALLQRSPSPNAAAVFLNWFLSREGQDAFFKADFTVPAHPALRTRKEYLGEFGDALIGRPWSMREPEDEFKVLPLVRAVWQPLWVG